MSETTIRLKYVTESNRQTLPEDTSADFAFHYVDISAVTQGHVEVPDEQINFETAPSRARRRAEPGDTLVSTVRTYLRAVAAVPVGDEELVFSTGFAVIHPDPEKVHPRFLTYQLQGEQFITAVQAVSTGVSYPATTATDVSNLRVWLPTLARQEAIADFLDRETAQIDAVIAKQEELIGLLGERRSAVIAHAVTKGLNPDTPMKDSGIDWLGAIPSHWDLKRLKYLGRSSIGLTYSPADVVDDPHEGTLVLRAGNIQDGQLTLDDNVYVATSVPDDLHARHGDILICARNGSARLIGKNVVIPASLGRATWGAFMTVLRSDYNDYLRWLLNSAIFTGQLGRFKTSTINQLTNETLNSFEIPLPPDPERAAIAAHLDCVTAEIDQLVARASSAIDLMRERRSALISDAVTGRLDIDTYGKGAA